MTADICLTVNTGQQCKGACLSGVFRASSASSFYCMLHQEIGMAAEIILTLLTPCMDGQSTRALHQAQPAAKKNTMNRMHCKLLALQPSCFFIFYNHNFMPFFYYKYIFYRKERKCKTYTFFTFSCIFMEVFTHKLYILREEKTELYSGQGMFSGKGKNGSHFIMSSIHQPSMQANTDVKFQSFAFYTA